IKDVAAEANVSVGTVYRAINNTGRIKATTRENVLKAVERLDYKANTVARGLALRKKFTILVIMPEQPIAFWGEVINGARKAAAELSEFGVKVLEHFFIQGASGHQSIMDLLSDNEVDAIAMSMVNFDSYKLVLDYSAENKIPVALFNEELENSQRFFFYGPNNYLAGQMAAELMYKFCGGFGKCCIISNVKHRFGESSIRRIQGFYDYIENNKLEKFRIIDTYNSTIEDIPILIQQMMKNSPEIKGFYFSEYSLLYSSRRLLSQTEKKYVVIGHEYTHEFKELLSDGSITALLTQEKVCQGYYPLMMLYDYLITGETLISDTYYSNINIIINSNLEYLKYSEYGCGYK
ncbi:MAG: substrate-binding domain-containing protein, partial [Clostridiales bacterium]|nr:substrate-binding domain-containing protein [Clostridiales bacterium]